MFLINSFINTVCEIAYICQFTSIALYLKTNGNKTTNKKILYFYPKVCKSYLFYPNDKHVVNTHQ